jgi:hypothetical protein
VKKYFEQKIGEPVAILCARYWYRGIVSDVNDSYVVLVNPFMVTETGAFTINRPRREDALPSDVAISYGAIEVVEQPTWCFAGYDVKSKEEKSKKK